MSLITYFIKNRGRLDFEIEIKLQVLMPLWMRHFIISIKNCLEEWHIRKYMDDPKNA
jgi:hypothetical protein